MRTASPWWASLVFGIGLVFLFVGERIVGSEGGGFHIVFTGAGLGAVVAVTGARAWTTLASTGPRRKIERTFLACHLATLFALFLYALTTGWGPTWSADSHAPTMLTVLYAVILVAANVPVLMMELSLGVAMRTNFDAHDDGGEFGGVEFYRVRELGWSGLSVGLALCFLMVTCKVASERNVAKDVSYFKTSLPGESTAKIVESSSEPVKVMLFFPEGNEVHDQVRHYFDELQAASGKLDVEDHDRVAEADLALQLKVTKDGVIALTRGTGDKLKSELIEVDTDIDKARKGTKLKNLDREVNTHLLKLVHDKGKIYLVAGHGEFTNPESMTPEAKIALGGVERGNTAFKKRLAELNYDTKDLGLMDLSKDVPDDASMVMLMAPTQALDDVEWAALARYLDKGGRMMIALDPKALPSLGPLGGKLGLKYNPGHLTEDKPGLYMPVRGSITDRRFALTSQFSAHASTTSLSRAKAGTGILMIDSGALEDAPFTKGALADQPKKTYTIRSMDSSYLDYNDNFQFDPNGVMPEKKQRWNLAAAVEGPKLPQDKDGFRALVFADVDLFTDLHVRDPFGGTVPLTRMIGDTLLDDSVKWLAHDENIVGEVESEDDKPISHTKGQDAAWFTLTIVGMPLLVLGLGLTGTHLRKKRRSKKEVTP